ncbi:MAG TPA: hypothetical protein VKY26_07625, partial [Actinomycetota bacterium]|nr:hypothetical protein [Actinomycetota bacterium]
ANGEIRSVANLSLDWIRATVDIVLPYGADLDAALVTAADEAQMMAGEPEWSTVMNSAPEAYAQAMDHESITMRVTARTPPGTSAGVSRTLLQRILSRLHSAGPMLVHTKLVTNPDGSVVISSPVGAQQPGTLSPDGEPPPTPPDVTAPDPQPPSPQPPSPAPSGAEPAEPPSAEAGTTAPPARTEEPRNE